MRSREKGFGSTDCALNRNKIKNKTGKKYQSEYMVSILIRPKSKKGNNAEKKYYYSIRKYQSSSY